MSDIFINPSSPLQHLNDLKKQVEKKEGTGSSDFAEVLSNALEEVDQLQKDSGQKISEVMGGNVQDVHSAMIAMQKADLSFQMMMQVRNKLVDAYTEIMRMQV